MSERQKPSRAPKQALYERSSTRRRRRSTKKCGANLDYRPIVSGAPKTSTIGKAGTKASAKAGQVQFVRWWFQANRVLGAKSGADFLEVGARSRTHLLLQRGVGILEISSGKRVYV